MDLEPDSPRDTWVFAGLIALLVWAPLPLGSNRTWALGILLAWVVVLLLGCAWAWRRHPDELFSRLERFRLPLFLLGGFALWSALLALPLPPSLVHFLSPEAYRVRQPLGPFVIFRPQTLSIDPFQAHIYAAASFLYLAAFVLCLLLVRSAKRLALLAKTLVWSGLFQSLLGILLFSFGAHYQIFFSDVSHDRLLGSFRNPNNMAGYLEMCLPVGIGLMLAQLGHGGPQHRGWKQKLSAVFEFILSAKMRLRLMLVIMVIALVLTGSRMGNTAFFAAMLLVGATTVLLKKRSATTALWLIASLIVIDILVIGSWVGVDKVVSRVQQVTLASNPEIPGGSVEERTTVPKAALNLIRDFPVTGTGGWSFYSAFMRYRPPALEAYYEHPHNDYVEIASDTGLVGLALLLAAGASSAWIMLRVLYRRQNPLARGIAFGSLMALVSLAIHCTTEFNLQIPANALTLTVVLAMGWLASALPSARTDPRHEP